MGGRDNEISRAAGILLKAKRAAAFCGSGISAESGIATFRDPGGIWDRLDLAEVGTPDGLMSVLMNDPGRLMPVFMELLDAFEKADANPGHAALAGLERMGVLRTVITQNIDNLQNEAGSGDVIEVHGNLFRMVCSGCGAVKKYDRKPLIADIKRKLSLVKYHSLAELVALVPRCGACGSLARPDVVMFGEAVKDLDRAFGASRDCDTMLVLGTSGIVYPAAALPYEAKQRGASIIVINPNENAFFDISDVYVPMKTGEALPAIVKMMKGMMD